jgi:hypothetical protein
MARRDLPPDDPRFAVAPHINEAMAKAVNLLHHISMRVCACFWEFPNGKQAAFFPANHPGVHDVRSQIDMTMFSRAEVSALTRLLIEKGVFTAEEYSIQATEEYECLANAKAREFNCTVTEYGLSFSSPHTPN